MSKILDKVIEEMGSYGDMGIPDGEGSMGMGTVSNMDVRRPGSGKAIKAYKMNDILRSKNRSEEEEGFDDMDSDMDNYETDELDGDIEELKQFFMDNPSPTDEEISMYADEHGMDLEEMREAVYDLIQSLLPEDEENIDDESDSLSDENNDEIDFSVRSDTGERPAKNEFEEKRYGRRKTDRSHW